MRRRIDEAARHEDLGPRWGELCFAPDGRRASYTITRRARQGWTGTAWQRWIPKTHNRVRRAGYFSR